MNAPALDAGIVAAARLWAATRAPYLASALFACSPVAAPGSGTVSADRYWRVHADPEVVATLDVPQLGRLLIHLTGHLLRDHAVRSEAFMLDDTSRPWWQRCTDAEINDDLARADLLPPVANDLPAALGAPEGQLAESYFALLPDEPPAPTSWDCGSCADGRTRGHEQPDDTAGGERGLTDEQADRLRHGVADDIRRHEGQQPGTVAAGWLRWAEMVAPSRTDWRRVLGAEIRRAVAAVAGSVDYSYRRPARRSHSPTAPGVVLPTLYRPVPEVAIVCDTSGSMDEEQLARVLAEVDAIIARAGLRATGAATLAVDAEVQSVGRARRAADVSLAGGGGTDMGVGIDAALARRPRPEVIVVLTDGFTPWPPARPRGVRVVVGLIGAYRQPEPPPEWARTVEIEL